MRDNCGNNIMKNEVPNEQYHNICMVYRAFVKVHVYILQDAFKGQTNLNINTSEIRIDKS